MSKKLFVAILVIVFMFVMMGCAQQATEAPAAPASGEAAFKVTGMVNAEQAWSHAEFRALDTMQTDATNKAGETTTYTGVPITKLLEIAGVKDGATTVAFIGDDGYTAEAPLADVQACADCIVGFKDDTSYIMVMPGFPGNVQVKGIIEINIK